METSGRQAGAKRPKGDELIGMEYRCCRGPNRSEAIHVVGPAAPGRFLLRAESGHQFTISREKLERIFGDPGSRSCGCMPWIESSLAATQPAPNGRDTRTPRQAPPEPAEASTAAEPPDSHAAAESDGAAEPVTPAACPDHEPPQQTDAAGTTAAVPASVISAVVFRDGEAQGALF